MVEYYHDLNELLSEQELVPHNHHVQHLDLASGQLILLEQGTEVLVDEDDLFNYGKMSQA